MKLNCKAGDLAIITKGKISQGRIVRVSHLAENGESIVSFCGSVVTIDESLNGKCWHLSDGIASVGCEKEQYWAAIAFDSALTPINDNDGQDETLTWKEVPKELENA